MEMMSQHGVRESESERERERERERGHYEMAQTVGKNGGSSCSLLCGRVTVSHSIWTKRLRR